MSRLDDIRVRVDAYAEGTTGREDRVYLLTLVDEARELLKVAVVDEWSTPINWNAERDDWIAKLGKEKNAV